jgi:peptidoglycan/LPS O-acetylase OafA/YrhL
LLDPLRAFAAWAVVAWHSSDLFHYQMPLFSSAAWAVDLFMNISGFLMLYHFLDREEREPWTEARTWRNFYVRRWFRIAPLYYLALFWVFLLPHASGVAAGPASPIPQAPFEFKSLLLHLSFLFGFFPEHAENTSLPDWSLALEMQFYFAFPALALLLRRIGCGRFMLLCAAVGAVARYLVGYYPTSAPGPLGWFSQPTLLPLKLQVFAVGMVAAWVYRYGAACLRDPWFALAIPVYAVTCKYPYARVLGLGYLGLYVLLAWPRTSASVWCVFGKLNAAIERRNWLRWPAELSYSGYLIHPIILTWGFSSWPEKFGGSLARAPYFWLAYLAVLVLVILAGIPLFKWIEKPGIAVGKRVIRWLDAQKR